MSFDPDTTDYETTRERLEARKANDIAIKRKSFLPSVVNSWKRPRRQPKLRSINIAVT
jgi:hypothetical protein